MFHTFFIELLEALLKFYDYGKTNKVSTAMFIKAREARSCLCQSCGEQLVAVVNFQTERDRDIGRPCRGRSPARGACRPVAQLAARRHSLSRFPHSVVSAALRFSVLGPLCFVLRNKFDGKFVKFSECVRTASAMCAITPSQTVTI